MTSFSQETPCVTVVGAGKMGLPLAAQLAHQGAIVIANDVNPTVVDSINRGVCPFDEPGVPELLERVVSQGNLTATTDLSEAVKQSNVIIIIVPVLLTDHQAADLTIIESVTAIISKNIQPNTLVVYETTLPVGTSRQLHDLILNRTKRTAGENYFGAFSPERVKSRLVLKHLTKNPKIVGGYTEHCAQVAEAFYAKYLGAPVINLKTLEASEFSKLADMVYRDVNIALANELSRYCDVNGMDFSSIRDAANTSGEAHLLLPGIGVGGHCTPVYPYFLINKAKEDGVPQKLTAEARHVNDGQAVWAVKRIEQSIGSLNGEDILILGLGFRPEVKEHTCSTAFLLQKELQNRQANISLHDPYYTHEEITAHGFNPVNDVQSFRGKVIILNTAHECYLGLDWAQISLNGISLVFDGRNCFDADQIKQSGLHYMGVGKSA